MKKSGRFMILWSICMLMSVCYIQHTLLLEKDNVIITEHVLYGEKTTVEDVSFERNMRVGYHIFWKNIYDVGEAQMVKTDYRFSERPDYEEAEQLHWEGISFRTDLEYDKFDKKEESQLQGLEVAYKELFDATANGEQQRKKIKVNTYMENYLFDMNLNLSGEYWSMEQSELLYLRNKKNIKEEEQKQLEEQLKTLEAFREFFKIPVIETEFCEIGVSKSKSGAFDGWSYQNYHMATARGDIQLEGINLDEVQSKHEDKFEFYVTSTVIGNTCYLTFQTYTEEGMIVDTSQIPGGYGIYRFTFDEKIDTNSLKMVYSLNPNSRFVSLEKDEKEENLLLFTEEDGKCYLTVIEIATMEAKQKIPYAPDIEEDKARCYWIYDDFIVAQYLYKKAVVLSMDETGMYHVEFTIDISDESGVYEKIFGKTEKPFSYPLECISGTMVFDWNGKEIVVGDSLWSTIPHAEKAGIYLAVFDKNGIQYCGEYHSSLDTGVSLKGSANNECYVADSNPLIINWKK